MIIFGVSNLILLSAFRWQEVFYVDEVDVFELLSRMWGIVQRIYFIGMSGVVVIIEGPVDWVMMLEVARKNTGCKLFVI